MNDALEVVQALMCCACNNPDHHDAAAVLAAASGPWAEQLDAAKATHSENQNALNNRCQRVEKANELLRAERDAALARNAELEAQLGPQSQTQSLTYRERLELMRASLNEAKDERDALRAELDNLRGKCICNTGPGTDGPDETCPVHGRSYAEWIERGDQKQAELDNLRDRVNALADKWADYPDGYGDHYGDELRAIVRGSDDEAGEDT